MTLNDRIIYNEREQVVSTDWNRDAQLTGGTLGGALQALLGSMPFSFWNHPGAAALQSSPFSGVSGVGVYLAADVFGGLMVNANNSGYLLVGAGALGVADPAANSFDSSYGIVVDPGVTSTTSLVFTPNASGLVRWDLVECRPVDTVISTESRNVLNEGTGAWVPTLIPKRKAGRLEYRIRSAAPGAGVPAPDPLWCPLAAIHVNSGASGFTQCDVYDLRPLVSERCPMGERRVADPTWTPDCRPVDGHAWSLQASPTILRGGILATGFGFWAGGVFKRSTPTSLADFGVATTDLDVSNVANQAAGTSVASSTIFSVVAHFPQGFPRWVKYQQVGGSEGRLPTGPRGVIWIRAGHVAGPNGVVSVGGTPPTVAGFGSVPMPGVLLSNVDLVVDGGTFWAPFTQDGPDWRSQTNSKTMTVATNLASITLVRGTDIPPQARAVRVLFRPFITFGGGATFDTAYGNASIDGGTEIQWFAMPLQALNTGLLTFDGTLAGPTPGSTVAAADPTFRAEYTFNGSSAATLVSAQAAPGGWTL